jgi:hypothetical protein
MFICNPPSACSGISQRCRYVLLNGDTLRSTHPSTMIGGCWTSIRRQLAFGRRYFSLLSRKSCMLPAPKAMAHYFESSAGNQYGDSEASRVFYWRGVLAAAGWKNRICWMGEDPRMHRAHCRQNGWAGTTVCMSICLRIVSIISFGNHRRSIILEAQE